jgi:hypothetical protein
VSGRPLGLRGTWRPDAGRANPPAFAPGGGPISRFRRPPPRVGSVQFVTTAVITAPVRLELMEGFALPGLALADGFGQFRWPACGRPGRLGGLAPRGLRGFLRAPPQGEKPSAPSAHPIASRGGGAKKAASFYGLFGRFSWGDPLRLPNGRRPASAAPAACGRRLIGNKPRGFGVVARHPVGWTLGPTARRPADGPPRAGGSRRIATSPKAALFSGHFFWPNPCRLENLPWIRSASGPPMIGRPTPRRFIPGPQTRRIGPGRPPALFRPTFRWAGRPYPPPGWPI